MNSFIQSCLDDKRAVILICVARDEREKLHVTVLKERIFAERLGYQVYKVIAVVQGAFNPLPRLFSMAQKKEIDVLLMDNSGIVGEVTQWGPVSCTENSL